MTAFRRRLAFPPELCWLGIECLPHDVDSEARALRAVVMTVSPNTEAACYTFSIRYENFAERTGLNMHGIRRLGFPSYLGWSEL